MYGNHTRLKLELVNLVSLIDPGSSELLTKETVQMCPLELFTLPLYLYTHAQQLFYSEMFILQFQTPINQQMPYRP